MKKRRRVAEEGRRRGEEVTKTVVGGLWVVRRWRKVEEEVGEGTRDLGGGKEGRGRERGEKGV